MLRRFTIGSSSGSLNVAVALVAREWPESLRDSDVRLELRNAFGLIMLELFGLEAGKMPIDRPGGRASDWLDLNLCCLAPFVQAAARSEQ